MNKKLAKIDHIYLNNLTTHVRCETLIALNNLVIVLEELFLPFDKAARDDFLIH